MLQNRVKHRSRHVWIYSNNIFEKVFKLNSGFHPSEHLSCQLPSPSPKSWLREVTGCIIYVLKRGFGKSQHDPTNVIVNFVLHPPPTSYGEVRNYYQSSYLPTPEKLIKCFPLLVESPDKILENVNFELWRWRILKWAWSRVLEVWMYFNHFLALTREGPSGAEMTFYFPAVVSSFFFFIWKFKAVSMLPFYVQTPRLKMRKENQHFHPCLLHFLSAFVNSRKVCVPCSPQRSTVCSFPGAAADLSGVHVSTAYPHIPLLTAACSITSAKVRDGTEQLGIFFVF